MAKPSLSHGARNSDETACPAAMPRTRLQREQKETSRQKLRDAARDLFTQYSYAYTTIDDIVRQAKVSRTTFYRYFDDKWAIASEVFNQLNPIFLALYDELASYDHPTEAQISRWLNKMLAVLKANRSLVRAMREADTIERQSDLTVTAMHNALIARLGVRIPAFRLPRRFGPGGLETQVRALLLMLQFDQFCYAVAVRESIDQRIGVRVMARQVCRFIEDGAAPRNLTSAKAVAAVPTETYTRPPNGG
jgi:AcrR family transcriptional regulator